MNKATEIVKILKETYPDACCSLDFKNAYELLIATILSAQCTDERVNIVTKELFQKYKTPEDFANATLEEMEEAVKSTGFYRNKAKNIIAAAQVILAKFHGEVPQTMEELLTLPGVGRKTANLVLGDVYNIPGIVVDTHVKRISKKLGLTKNDDPEKIEYDLMKVIPKENWTDWNHLLVFHGRAVCNAKKPECMICPINHLCDAYNGG
ncbi:MAG: endonuclease III [Abditibacteriota bacterium]|nr:endonuclease III [Abditibacteriota bacterium]